MSLLASITPPPSEPVLDLYPARKALVSGTQLRRLLPRRERRTIGPWCFIDHAGPTNEGFDVGEHPHIGLQTMTWLLEGEVLHRDNLGSDQRMRPGQLNWMTSGRGIAHAEQSHGERMHGIQMWVALPESARNCEPHFDHYTDLPIHQGAGWRVTILAGEALGTSSPARTYSPMVGLELYFERKTIAAIPVSSEFEHGLFVISGEASIDDTTLERDVLAYLGTKRQTLELSGNAGTRIMILGGLPFGEPILMWWNFVARTEAEITAARERWQDRGFPAIPKYVGPWIDAPPLRLR